MPQIPTSNGPCIMVGVRFSPDEYRVLVDKAAAERRRVSNMVRVLVMEAIEARKGERKSKQPSQQQTAA